MTNVIFFSIKESKMSHISDNLEWRMQERSRFRFLGKLRPVNRAKLCFIFRFVFVYL